MPLIAILPWPLFAGGALSIWVSFMIRRRRQAPGAHALLWLLVMVGWWCVAGGFHALAGPVEGKVAWAKVQYVAIASVPVLWLLFAAEYAQTPRANDRRLRAALWLLPAATLVAVLTNERHHWIWPTVEIASNGVTVYGHAWFFWLDAAYNYAMVLGGASLLLQALRRSPPPFRRQWIQLIVAAVFPLAANLLYLSGATIPGLDFTPLAFTVSGLLFAQAIYQEQLFDLIPVARDVVIENLSDAVIVVDGARRVLDMNASARRMAGHPAVWVGWNVTTLLPMLSRLALEAADDTASMITIKPGDGGDPQYYEARVIHVRGRRDSSAAWVLVLRDATEQVRAEAERAALRTRVQEQQKRESLSVLAGGLAHDFNNLLTGIVGNADLLSLQIPPSSELGNSVGAILLGAQRAADLVDKMLAYAGERHGSIERVNLDELIGDMVDLLRASVARHCTLRYEGKPSIVDGDPTQIRQVVMNLIINAADAVDEGAGTITVTTGIEKLTASALAEVDTAPDAKPGVYAYLDVADDGAGMDQATLGKIFEPFFTTKHSGHGLGLAAVQGIVYGHHGALRVESQRGVGSSFRVWLPIASSDQVASTGTSAANPSEPSVTSKS
jgi:signal transduction histidine kinase